jgi:deoxycytidine triphosphate deaminase
MNGLLPHQEIRRLLETGEVLEDWIEDNISAASYELRLGSYIDERTGEVIPMEPGRNYGLTPRGFVLLGVVERILYLPDDIVGMLYLRSTLGRRGFSDWQKGIVDPGYSGGLTIPLHNVSRRVIRLVGHERAVHLTFERMAEGTDKPYRGAYQDSKGPTGSRYDDELRLIGQAV